MAVAQRGAADAGADQRPAGAGEAVQLLEDPVERVVRLGFEVRIDLRADSGERFAAQVTRAEADRQRFTPGEVVFARAARPADATDAEPALAI